MLQTVLVLSALFQVASLLLARVQGIGIDHLAVGMGIANVALLLACLVLLRRGALAAAAWLFVASSLALLSVAYLRWGLTVQAPQQLLQLVPVLIGGALLGRLSLIHI